MGQVMGPKPGTVEMEKNGTALAVTTLHKCLKVNASSEILQSDERHYLYLDQKLLSAVAAP